MNPTFNLPDKKAYTGRVVGNGMVLGLKNATQNLGLNMISGGALTGYVGDYGKNIGTHSGSNSNDVGTYGITTESDMIVEQDSDLVICIRF